MASLYQLAYISDAVLPSADDADGEDLIDWQLAEIVETSIDNNTRDQITGAMLFNGRHYAQVLEGPQHEVRRCFDRISRDARHTNLRSLFYGPLQQRRFTGWSMALYKNPTIGLPYEHYDRGSPSDAQAASRDVAHIIEALSDALDDRTGTAGRQSDPGGVSRWIANAPVRELFASYPARLLVVDDDAPLLRELSENLAGEGYRVETASCGEEALALLSDRNFDLLISDIRMPNGDGAFLLKSVRAVDKSLPFIFMTGFSDLQPSEAKELGANGFFYKPLDVEHLFASIEQELSVVRT